MMKKHLSFLMLFCAFWISAQTTVSGTITDDLGNTMPGVMISVMHSKDKTVSGTGGRFTISTDSKPPFTLVFEAAGGRRKEVAVNGAETDLNISFEASNSILDAVVLSASRVEERLLESPVTIEKLTPKAIQATGAFDYFNAMNSLKGVTSVSGSMTFNAINTRGFGGIANTRFVQLVDGIDNQAPILNFPLGNLIGIGATDIKDIELVPGAASALYGPNAFNGIMIMRSKTPWDQEGLTVDSKIGFSKASNDTAHPMYDFGFRYAQIFGKFGLKITADYLRATDWLANDYKTDVVTQKTYTTDPFIDPITHLVNPGNRPINFNGVNTYGDESVLSAVPLGALQMLSPATATGLINLVASNLAGAGLFPNLAAAQGFVASNFRYLPTVDIRRTGLTEQELLDNRKASSVKTNVALYYRVNDDLEFNYDFRYGSGNSIYQGSERYALRDFGVFSNKLEAKGKNFLFRTYMTQTNAGKSYNMTALGSYTNELLYGTAAFGTQPGWANIYLGNFVANMMAATAMSGAANLQQLIQSNPASLNVAYATARMAADAMMPKPGTAAFQNAVETIRKTLFQHEDPSKQIFGGAAFEDHSRLFNTEGTYDFTSAFDNKLGLLVGGNHRLYSLFTNGTILNEDPDGTGAKRININEYGAFVQLQKGVLNEHVKFTGSIRYDKNENFRGVWTPRLAAVTTLGEKREHNIRASFQTGFRNPDTQAAFIYFPASTILLGGAKKNAERYGLYNGGAYTAASFNAFRASALAGSPNPSLLVTEDMPFVKPEKLSTVEIGYKGLIDNLFVDWNLYYNWYRDFITQSTVVAKVGTSQQGQHVNGVSDFLASGGADVPAVWSAYNNSPDKVTSWGTGLGLTYNLPRGYQLTGNYTHMDYNTKDKARKLQLGFNSPKDMFNLGFRNMNISRTGLGFDVGYRWQGVMYWYSSFGQGNVPSFGTLDASLFYTLIDANLTFKLGGTNLIGRSYRTNIGGPYIGKIVSLGITYNTDFKSKK